MGIRAKCDNCAPILLLYTMFTFINLKGFKTYHNISVFWLSILSYYTYMAQATQIYLLF